MTLDFENRWAAVWMISAAYCFATMGAFTHAVGSRCDWMVVVLVRIVCTFGLSVFLAWSTGASLVLLRPRTLWVRSIAGTISLVCTFYALVNLPVADVLTLTNVYPIWVVLFSMSGEPQRRIGPDLVCVASAVAGVVLIQSAHFSGKGGFATLVALFASFTTAIAMLGLHRLKSVDAKAVVAHFSGLASLVIGAWIALHPTTVAHSAFDRSTEFLLLGVGLSGTAGQVLLTKAFAAGPPAQISVLSLTQILFALAYDILIMGRVMTWPSLLGTLLILVPSAWITLQPRPTIAGNLTSSETKTA